MFEEVKGPVVYTFGVRQGEQVRGEDGVERCAKLRRILDFRGPNELVGTEEKMRLPGHLTIITMIQMCMATTS